MEDPITFFAVLALVLCLAAPLYGVIAQAPISFPMVFLGLGLLLSPMGIGAIEIGLDDPLLVALAALTLAFVLFVDALKLDLTAMRRNWVAPALLLGPGTILVIGLGAIAAFFLLGLGPTEAILLGAILSSTDPVVLRDVLRNDGIPHSVRHALSLEAGLNDIVVLPTILTVLLIQESDPNWSSLLGFGLQTLLLGPVVGVILGGGGSWLIGYVDRRHPIPADHQAIFGVGLVFASYTSGELLHSDGLLATFAAGVSVASVNRKLRDAFIDYGEITAAMTTLVSFVLLGVVLASVLPDVATAPALFLAFVMIFAVRPLAVSLALLPTAMSRTARSFMGWFGPRGLNSLLFGLLIVHAGAPAGAELFAIAGLVVIVSVIAHGTTASPAAGWYARREVTVDLPEGAPPPAGRLVP